ncbi:unnamed protein product [Rhizophagus irregularis]|nr:unnamed protein product [Rhizophagus irregularis]
MGCNTERENVYTEYFKIIPYGICSLKSFVTYAFSKCVRELLQQKKVSSDQNGSISASSCTFVRLDESRSTNLGGKIGYVPFDFSLLI